VCDEEEGCPENGGANGEMVVEAAGGRSKIGFGLVIFVEARGAKTLVGVLVVFGEIEAVLDEWRASKGVIADAVAANPGIQKRKRAKKEKKKQALRSSRAAKRRWAEVLLVHQRGTRRKPSLFPAAMITGQHHDREPMARNRGRDLVTATYRGGIVAHDFTLGLDIGK